MESFVKLLVVVLTMTALPITAEEVLFNVTDIMTTSAYEDMITSDIVSDFDKDASSGWAWYPLKWTWWLIIRVIVAIIGILGNGIVLVIIYQRFAIIKSTDVFIGALAVADFLTSVFLIPIPYAAKVPGTTLGSIYCKVMYPSLFFWLCIVASTYILMTICIDRYIAVIFPLYYNRVASKQRANVCILCIWVVSILQCLYTLFVYIYDEDISYCASTITTVSGNTARGYYAFTTRLVVPVLIMLITQILIARSLKRQAKRFQGMVCNDINSRPQPSFHIVARNRVIKMMLIVVLVYVFTWTPNQIAYFCFNLGYISSSYRGSSLHNILTVLGFVNSCANPFIYAARNPEFRSAVRSLFSCSQPGVELLFSGKVTEETTLGNDLSSRISKVEEESPVGRVD